MVQRYGNYISTVQYKAAVSTSSAVQPIERFPRNPAGRLLVVRLAPGISLLALLSLARSLVAECSTAQAASRCNHHDDNHLFITMMTIISGKNKV